MQKPKTLKDLTHDLLAANLAPPMDAQGRPGNATKITRLDIMVGTHEGRDPREYVESTMALMRALHIAELMHEDNTLATVHADPGNEYCGWILTLNWNHVPTMVINLGTDPSEIKDFYNGLFRREWFLQIPTVVDVLIDFGGVLSEQAVFFATYEKHSSSGLLTHFLKQGGYDAVNNQALEQGLAQIEKYRATLNLDVLSGGIDHPLDVRPRASVDPSQEVRMVPYALDTRVNLTQRADVATVTDAPQPKAFQPQRLHPETLTTEQLHHLQALLGLQADEAQALVSLADELAKGRTESFESSTEETNIAERLDGAIRDHLIKHTAPKLVVFQTDPTDPDPDASVKFLQRRILETGSLPGAMAILNVALHNDDAYAWGWHANIAMCMQDEGVGTMKAQRGAARFLQTLTMNKDVPGIDTTQFKEYQDIERRYNEEFKDKE